MPWFGHKGVSIIGFTLEGRIMGSIFTCPENCIADSITLNLRCTADHKTMCMIYRNSDCKLIGQTEEKTLPNAAQHDETFDFIIRPSLTGGVAYWLCAWSEAVVGTNAIYYEADVTNDAWRDSEVYDSTPPDPCVKAIFSADNVCFIWCDYTSAVTPLGLGLKPAPKGGVGRPAMLTGGASFGG